jgi:hypothetical protein
MGPTFESKVGTVNSHPSNIPAEHEDLPVWNADNRFHEDWQPVPRIRSLRRTIAESELALSREHLPTVKYKRAGDFAGRTEKTS